MNFSGNRVSNDKNEFVENKHSTAFSAVYTVPV
jgi:hypothetical protein